MPTLSVSDFSCLRNASIEVSPVTVIIGPQGSGKSVTTKLLYFLTDIMSSQFQAAERGTSIDEFKRSLARQFNLWFPSSAWGSGRFNINYSSGAMSVRILRRVIRGQLSDEVSVSFSDWFSDYYNQSLDLYKGVNNVDDIDIETNAQVAEVFDKSFKIREVATRRLWNDLRDNYINRQTFIPAGRAFFTSLGKLVAGFDQASSLDPITIKFAKLFANLRERNSHRIITRPSRLGPDFLDKRTTFMENLFGGSIRFEDDAEFVETLDGRRIPFSSLSSGQQELLPMWSLVDYYNELDYIRFGNNNSSQRRGREIIYIEEPEAHLFPSAQSLLMDFLIGSVTPERNKRSLVITTHSPYIMGKLNVFLKAGQLAKRKKRNQDINEVVPREYWLSTNALTAVAIVDGELMDLIDEEGLIDGSYLDDISEEVSRQFSKLLKIESEI